MPPSRRIAVSGATERLFEILTLERGLLVSLLALACGAILLVGAVVQWRTVNFGDLDYSRTMRWVVPGATLAVLGFQTALSSFFISILRMRRA